MALRVARIELRRAVRSTVSNRTRLLLYGLVGLLVFLPFLSLGGFLLQSGGEELAAGVGADTAAVLSDGVAGGTAMVLFGLAVMATIRTFVSVASLDKPDHLLVATSVRTTVFGLAIREIALFLLWLGIPVAILSLAFASGASAPLVPLVVFVILTFLVLVAVSVGFVVGVSIRHVFTTYEPVARFRTPILVAVGAAYFLGIALGWIDRVVSVLFDLFVESPLAWPGELLLIALPAVEGTLWQGVAGLVGGSALAAGALLAGTRVANYHWFADPATGGEETTKSVRSSNRVGNALSTVVSRPTMTVAVTAIRRTRRAPIRLAYAAYPMLGAIFFVESVLETGSIPTFSAILAGIYVVWAAGALFTLNVLGEQGQAMDAVLTSSVSGRAVVAGTVLAGVIVVLPLALAVPPLVGFISPLGLIQTGQLLVAVLVGVLVAPLLATGVGSLYPRFGSVNVTRNRQTVMPSKTAFLVYTLALALPAGSVAVLRSEGAADLIASIVSFLFSLLPTVELSVPATAITVIASVLVVAGVIAPFLSVRYAIRRFDRYCPH